MNLQEAKELLKNNGYKVIKEEFSAEETAKINSEKNQLLLDELNTIKNEFTPEESKLIGLDAIIGNVKNGFTKYETGETSIVIHYQDYYQNPELFKKFTEIAKSHGFEVEYTSVKRGVFVDLSWLF